MANAFRLQCQTVNSYITRNYKFVSYPSTRTIVEFVWRLGPGAWPWLADMDQAYRRVHIKSQFWRYLGFRWYNRAYAMTCLPFGLASSCQIYTRFATAIRILAMGLYPELFYIFGLVSIYNYLDDFIGGASSEKLAIKQFEKFLEHITWLGVPTQPRKCQPPSQLQQILGFLYNTLTQMMSIPEDKAAVITLSILDLLRAYHAHTPISRRALTRVVGRLMWASQVCFPSRAFLRRLEALADLPMDWDVPCLTLEAIHASDLAWWLDIVNSAHNGISFDFMLRPRDAGDIHVWTDASGSHQLGFGGYCSLNRFFQITWAQLNIPAATRQDIQYQELLAICTAAETWVRLFPNRSITFWCDNYGVCRMLFKGSTMFERPDLMALIRRFCKLAFIHRFYFWMNWLATADNQEADNLSRCVDHPFARLETATPPYSKGVAPYMALNPPSVTPTQWSDDSKSALGNACNLASLPLEPVNRSRQRAHNYPQSAYLFAKTPYWRRGKKHYRRWKNSPAK